MWTQECDYQRYSPNGDMETLKNSLGSELGTHKAEQPLQDRQLLGNNEE